MFRVVARIPQLDAALHGHQARVDSGNMCRALDFCEEEQLIVISLLLTQDPWLPEVHCRAIDAPMHALLGSRLTSIS